MKTTLKLADVGDLVHITNSPKKRKIVERLKGKLKKQELSNHTTGPDCKFTRFKCFEILIENDRTCLLAKFNSMSTKDLQDFLTGLITVCYVTRRRPRKEDPIKLNSNSYKYKVFLNSKDQFVQVCFYAFLLIFGIKKGRLETIKRSLSTTGRSTVYNI